MNTPTNTPRRGEDAHTPTPATPLYAYLGLGPDWDAERFPFGIHLTHRGYPHARGFIPLPYEKKSRDWWIATAQAQARAALAAARNA